MGDPRAAAALVLAMLDGERVVRHAAVRSLQQVDPYWERLDSVDEILPQVRSRIEDPDYGVRRAATDILRRCGDATGGTSHTTITSVRRKRQAVEDVLLALMTDHDPALRQAAVECLSDQEDSPTGAWWSPLLEDSDASVRRAANRVGASRRSGGRRP
jgi:HEAT repeat protein